MTAHFTLHGWWRTP
ncbi:hypothetical protein DN594_18540 [Enterobacter cloacae]|nr:trp operon leader peptide [Enterobacter roggenkampii]MBW9384385.1 trp operon leader peptide [Enterobacter sp. EC_64]RWS56023.1 hypothetical protein DN594_18540 [Enterobacter cloacae]EKY3952713.1 trp operon leader peptide [Enterobacter roggenkampii]ELK1939619.1 trp operon leader peptide [Enterobacter roggenkampii]